MNLPRFSFPPFSKNLAVVSVGCLLALSVLACGGTLASGPAPTVMFESPVTQAPATIDPAEIQKQVAIALTQIAQSAPPVSAQSTLQVPVAMEAQADQYAALYAKVSPAVVAIYVETRDGAGQGSGYVYDKTGHIVTNLHVVENGVYVEVTFPSGFRTTAKVLGTDASADLAVLRLDEIPRDLVVLPLGDSDQLHVGDPVVAIGNPFGFAGTMTTGIVSALGRALTGQQTVNGARFSAPDIIQTDTAINPGNSGGPLINMQGEVVGINRAIISASGSSSGVGFSISSNTVKRIIPALLESGKYPYPYLGISSTDALTLADLEDLGLPKSGGVYVTAVVAGGPAAKAGLKSAGGNSNNTQLSRGGDFIQAVNGEPVASFEELISYLFYNTEVGDEITLTIWRNGKSLEVPLTLGERP